MQLSDLLQTLRRHRALLVGVFGLCLALALAAAFVPAPRYRATTTLLVQPDLERLQFGAVQAVEFAMPAFIIELQSRALEQRSRAALPDDLQSIDAEMRGESEPGTGILRLIVESTDRDIVAPLADAAADRLAEAQPDDGLFLLEILEPAETPAGPFAPAKAAILLSGTILGLLAAVAAALTTSFVRNSFDIGDDIRRRLKLPVLGEIPQLPRGEEASKPEELFRKGGEHQRVVEAYQLLRTNLEFALFSQKVSSAAITVTSCSVGEGKSTMAANLGWLMASSGYKVLLVDGDLRRPKIHEYLDVAFDGGVSLAARTPGAETAITSTTMPNLKVVPAGVPSDHPSEVLSAALPGLLDGHKGPRRLVLVDTPPVNSVAETAITAGMTGFAVLVVDASRNDRADLERAVRRLRESGAVLLGVVINRTKSRRGELPDDYYFTSSPTPGTAQEPPRQVPDAETATDIGNEPEPHPETGVTDRP